MKKLEKPIYEIVYFSNDVIVTSACGCDIPGVGSYGDDEECTGGTGEGGDVECIVTDSQGNC